MKSSGKKLSLTSYDDIFTTEDIRQEDRRERVMEISLDSSNTFTTTPFRCGTTKPYRIWQIVSGSTACYLPALRDRSPMAADMKLFQVIAV